MKQGFWNGFASGFCAFAGIAMLLEGQPCLAVVDFALCILNLIVAIADEEANEDTTA